MGESGEFQCPWCGQSGVAVVDTGISFQRFITDCEVCCRPIEVVVECAEGEILSLDARPG
ncbi:MAG: CPXCG motif-containing cysteine-rich protein [Verrucomicrobiales bacterium]|nr:CPXCG motif-containing cysteine-rich protein [Verrucomicrobiales bacterium]